jgi:hypothetical protein
MEQRKIEKLKKKLMESKSSEVASSSSSNEETDTSSEEEVKDKKGKRETSNLTTQLSLIMIIYLTLAPSLQYPLVTPPPHFDGMDYTKWSYSMRMHLISLSLSV